MKKTSLIPTLLSVAFLFGCSSIMLVGSKHSKYGSTVEVLENGANAKIEYKSYEYMLSELNEEASVQMWSEDKMQLEKSKVPSGGYILVHVSGPTIGSANTKYWEYVIQSMDGKEIFRQEGDDDIPEHTTSQYGTVWWNIDGVYLRESLAGPFKVYVLDKLSNKRSGFIVFPNQ